MEDLVKEYNLSLAPILEKRRELKYRIKQLDEYSKTKYVRKADKLAATEEKQALEAEDSIFAGMQSDLEFAIEWLKTGHQPGVTRGIERRATAEREMPVDPLLMQRYFRSRQPDFPWDTEQKESVVGRSEKEILDKAMDALSDKEKEVLLLFKGKSFSQYKIAEIMNISRNSVKTMLSRANKKINHILEEEKGAG